MDENEAGGRRAGTPSLGGQRLEPSLRVMIISFEVEIELLVGDREESLAGGQTIFLAGTQKCRDRDRRPAALDCTIQLAFLSFDFLSPSH